MGSHAYGKNIYKHTTPKESNRNGLEEECLTVAFKTCS